MPENGTMLQGYSQHGGGEIAEGAPWISAIALLCVLAVAVGATRSGVSWLDAIGVGLTNLGYILALAGLMAEHFGALGLVRRWQVFLAATLVWLTGMILGNVQLSTA